MRVELVHIRLHQLAGSIMGREIVYERSRELVKADVDKLNPHVRGPRPR